MSINISIGNNSKIFFVFCKTTRSIGPFIFSPLTLKFVNPIIKVRKNHRLFFFFPATDSCFSPSGNAWLFETKCFRLYTLGRFAQSCVRRDLYKKNIGNIQRKLRWIKFCFNVMARNLTCYAHTHTFKPMSFIHRVSIYQSMCVYVLLKDQRYVREFARKHEKNRHYIYIHICIMHSNAKYCLCL